MNRAIAKYKDSSKTVMGSYKEFSVSIHENVEYYMKSLYSFVDSVDSSDSIRYKTPTY